MKTAKTIGMLVILGLLLSSFVLAWQWQTRPVFESLEYSVDGKTWKVFEQPLWLWDDAESATVRATFTAPPLGPERYVIDYAGSLSSLHINGTAVTESSGKNKIFALGPHMKEGQNSLVTTMKTSPSFRFLSWSIATAPGDPACLILLSILCTVALAVSYVSLRRITSRGLAAALTLGIGLRLLYVLSTPEWVRSYDWDGHRAYVFFVTHGWTIPPAALGWETYQPPLFYFLAAALRTLLFVVGFARYESLQILPFLLSVITLGIGALVSRMLFQSSAKTQVLFVVLLATFPGLITQSSNISNDGLFTLLGVLWLLFLVRFQMTQTMRQWLFASFVLTIALLTKTNALILLSAQILSLLVLRLPWRRRASLLGWLFLMVTLGAGWLFALRFIVEKQTSIVGNVHELPDILRVSTSIHTMLSFDVLEVMRMPFLNDIADWTRRQYFLEYLFKSAFFGSHMFIPLLDTARLLLLSGLCLLSLAITGAVRTWQSERTQVFLVIIACLVGAVLCYRLTYPMSSNQHFRFITPVIVPLAALIMSSTNKNILLETFVGAFALLSTVFFCSIAVQSL